MRTSMNIKAIHHQITTEEGGEGKSKQAQQ